MSEAQRAGYIRNTGQDAGDNLTDYLIAPLRTSSDLSPKKRLSTVTEGPATGWNSFSLKHELYPETMAVMPLGIWWTLLLCSVTAL